MNETARSSGLQSRRPPAHLSVSLRHDSSRGNTATEHDPTVSRMKIEQSNNGNVVGLSTIEPPTLREAPSAVQNWFDQSNSRPEMTLDRGFTDGESPYFLRKHDSSNTDLSELSRNGPRSGPKLPGRPKIEHRVTNGSSADEFRSVIDDLTIENRKLKERLRKYEGSSGSPHLDKDKLFEVKFHGLPSKKRHELEEILRNFAASINGTSEPGQLQSSSRNGSRRTGDTSHNPSLTSTSNSRPIDSAYASMSTSGPTSLSASNNPSVERKHESRSNEVQKGSVQTYLQNIPDGLLPKRSTVMTERQKKNEVVRRLEQLFTGKKEIGQHSHPLQQQEVSNSATRADRAADGLSSLEGLREAHILPYQMEVDASKIGILVDASVETTAQIPSDSTTPDEDMDSSPDQRPTRPLDLDPDRAQIPSDNLEYIRHLGLSTPQFARSDSTDAAADADGWIYLNLLVNMAQLHIINVTPDFVRSAVADVSEKFQLSRDGKKVRWRGGTKGTRFSSDSGNSSARNQSSQDSDSPNEENRKRRKIDVGSKFASAPVASDPFHYKPLFYHQTSSSEELSPFDDSDSPFENTGRGSGYGTSSHAHRAQGHNSTSSIHAKRDHGPIVYYSGATFCTDLSGDRGDISTPIHVTGVGKDGYSNYDHTQDALGSNSDKRPLPERTTSGSLIPFRPFKDYSKLASTVQLQVARPKTPELLSGASSDLEFSPPWSSEHSPETIHLQEFAASGLGGTQPADHFTAQVITRRTVLNRQTRARLSRYSAPGPAARRFLHRIPKNFLDTFTGSREKDSPEAISSALAELNAFGSPPPQPQPDELPVKIEVVSAEFSRLDPSPLPEPSGYFARTSSSDEDSTYCSSSSLESQGRGARPLFRRPKSFTSYSNHFEPQTGEYIQKVVEEEEEDYEDDDEDDDESIDMLAHARQHDPVAIAAQEAEFSRCTAASVASINGEGGYSSDSSSNGSSSSDDDDDDEEMD